MSFRLARFINIYLLITLTALVLSGLYGLFFSLNGWLWEAHRISGWLLVAVTGLVLLLGAAWDFRLAPERLKTVPRHPVSKI